LKKYAMNTKSIKAFLSGAVRRLLGEAIIARVVTALREQRLKKDYSPHATFRQTVIYMADGKLRHGGLADRLKGMLTTYQCCKDYGCLFKINHTVPFNLAEFLTPNRYDWTCPKDQISYNSRIARPVYIRQEGGGTGAGAYGRFARQLLKCRLPQLHAYTGCGYKMDTFSRNFHELFKPSPLLSEALQPHRAALDEDGYVSASFRFQSLLGDFVEPHSTVLNEEDQQSLIEQCIRAVDRIKQQHRDAGKVLVTSDSSKFRSMAAQVYPYVYIVHGELGHIDYGASGQLSAFLDFFLIAGAKKAYRVSAGQMYKSDFARCAALVGGKPYEPIEIA
jgi:hypothetical protein